MSGTGSARPGGDALELPPYSLDVQPLDLGPGTSAVGLELLATSSREPLRGSEAGRIWAAAFPALATGDSYSVDVFSHLERVREFCKSREIAFREAAQRCLVLAQPSTDQLRQFFERFEGETFGVRAGEAVREPDAVLEGELSRRGLDAYQEAYERYAFCAVCEPMDAWVTLLSKKLHVGEVTRHLASVAQEFDVYIARPH